MSYQVYGREFDSYEAAAAAIQDAGDVDSQITRLFYRLTPASDPQDFWAAGYDGNDFDTREEANEAIPNLRACGADFDHDWLVVKVEEVVSGYQVNQHIDSLTDDDLGVLLQIGRVLKAGE